MSVKINKLEIENVKRVKAVTITPTETGLTILGGNNNQGKTSVLDAIAWALGGNKYKPSDPQREGAVVPPSLKVTLSNGLIVERKGKNSDLKVIDPRGQKAGQQLLDSFVEELAINLPKFMESSSKEKANTLLQIIGVGEQLHALEKQENDLYNQRRAIGQIADQKEKYAKEQPYFNDVPDVLISVSELIQQQQDILARNGENARKRQNLAQMKQEEKNLSVQIEFIEQKIQELNLQKGEMVTKQIELNHDIVQASKTVESLIDESTEELEKNIQEVDDINRKVRANLDKEKAEDDAKAYRTQYDSLSAEIEDIREAKTKLLDHADLPLPGLSVADGELIYLGQKWDNMSGSQQLQVSTAIVRKLKPECGFVLLDKLEQMDKPTLEQFGKWLEAEGLQAIATRVSTGEECQIIIEDGYVKESNAVIETPKPQNDWANMTF